MRAGRIARVLLAIVAALALTAGTASAQNEGRVSVSAGIDFSSSYYFRGIVQETSGFIAQPYLEAGMSLFEGENGSVSLAAGTWSSLHSVGDAGFDGAPESFYETDFYAGLGFGFANGFGADVTYTAYMSPRGSWGTVKELAIGLSHDDVIAPYITVAFEIDGSAAGDNEGTYLELGIEPSLPLDDAPVGVSFPVAIGLSPSDYYDPDGVNEAFGFFSVGAMLGVPISGIPAEFGSWEFTAGVQLLFFGDVLKTINGSDDGVEPIGIFGLSLGY
ncbi:MAG: hypothetical protein OXF27_02430 [Acidobacteria bacterium]|nr:hypothetical protein [Acidobacteriota bacterium]